VHVANPRPSLRIGVWLAITASAIAGLLAMARREQFDAADLLVPVALGMLGVGLVAGLQEFGPEPLQGLARNQRFLVAFTLGLSALIVLWVLATQA